MSAEHRMKQGDLLPPVRGTLYTGDGKPQPLGSAVVRFHMWDNRGVLKIDAAAIVVDALLGKVKYDWVGTDTDTPGTYHCEFEVDFSGAKMTFPNDRHGRVVITKTRI